MLTALPATRKPEVRHWLRHTVERLAAWGRPPQPAPAPAVPVAPASPPPIPLVRPNLSVLARPEAVLPQFVQDCPVAQKYRRLFADLTWAQFPERPTNRPWPGPTPAPRAPFVAAYLVKLEEEKPHMADLRTYLVEHPALVWLLGFPLVPSATAPWGFDVAASLPTTKHFGRVLRELPNAAAQFLLDGTVTALQVALPPEVNFGDVVACDTKHIIAWVKENNPKAYIKDRYDKTQQPAGDPDCKLGCKRRHNRNAAGPESTREAAEGAAPTTAGTSAPASGAKPAAAAAAPAAPTAEGTPARKATVGEYYWGYASGVIATKVPDWGEFVLAELTQTFDQPDVSYFFPLMAQVERRLGRKPRYGALDMGFDAHYIYDYFHTAGGFAAIPLAERGDTSRQFDAAGLPLCPAGLAMPRKGVFTCHTTRFAQQRGRYACPLRYPKPTGETCPNADPHWAKGGCVVTMPTSTGARIRYQLDREAAEFKAIYKQRTADERVNSQALELGIERPKLRNGAAIANQNTLIYVLINLRALHRVRAHRAELARQTAAVTAPPSV